MASTADWGEEAVYYEGPPSYGDLATNIVLGTTLLWLVRKFGASSERPFSWFW